MQVDNALYLNSKWDDSRRHIGWDIHAAVKHLTENNMRLSVNIHISHPPILWKMQTPGTIKSLPKHLSFPLWVHYTFPK